MQQGPRRVLVRAGGVKGHLSRSWGLEEPLSTYVDFNGVHGQEDDEGGKGQQGKGTPLSVRS